MTCESLETRIALLVEGDLAAEETVGLESHLAGCARCRGFAQSLADSQRALKDLAGADLDAAALAAVRQGVCDALDRRTPRLPVFAALAAAAAAALALFVLRMEPRRRPEPPSLARIPSAPPRVASDDAAGPARPPEPTRLPKRIQPSPRPAQRLVMSLEPTPSVASNGGPQEEPPPVIKVVTSDPDVVIFWSTEPNGGGEP